MKIQVEKRHIAAGNCKVAQQCMIAQAIKEFDPTISYVAVRTNGITVTKRKRNGNSVREHYAVPLMAARRIIAFDRDEPVAPFSFEAKLIDTVTIPPVAQERARDDARRTLERRAKLKAQGIPTPKYGRRSRVAGV